jgi:serine O-acetyltransferase
MTGLLRHIQQQDDARPTIGEVIFAYPGFHIMTIFHPVAHFLWNYKLRALARFWSYVGRLFTGIEIHPGAQIGKNMFIDHGTGVVIGQTAIIGDNCLLYHGVTLGSRGHHAPGEKRHPTLGNNVVIGAGAQVLGPITVGDDARIGSNAVVTVDVPPCFTAVGNPARLVAGKKDGEYCAYGLPDGDIPDPLAATIDSLHREMNALKSFVETSRSGRPEKYSGPTGI